MYLEQKFIHFSKKKKKATRMVAFYIFFNFHQNFNF